MTTTFDIEAFNEAAMALWSEAKRQGHYEGKTETTDRLVREHAKALLGIAEMVLEGIVSGCPGSQDEARRQLQIAKRILGRTPMVVRQVHHAVLVLDKSHPGYAQSALDLVRLGLAELDTNG